MKSKRNKSPQELPYFYAPNIADTHYLSEEESHHLARVLRLVAGDEIVVTNGKGEAWHATVTESHPKRSLVTLLRPLPSTKSYQGAPLHLAIAPTKNIDRIEWLLEKCVEIGIQELSFLQTEQTIRNKMPMERLERLMISAMKQSQKWHATKLQSYDILHDFLQIVTKESGESQRFIAYCGVDNEKQELTQLLKPNTHSVIMIGPEGDFTPEEVKMAKTQGFKTVSLGEERLRTETAGLYAVMVHHIIHQLHQK